LAGTSLAKLVQSIAVKISRIGKNQEKRLRKMFMKKLTGIQKIRKSGVSLILLIAFGVFGNIPQIYAHGGEDHGDSQPKSTADVKGIVLHTARLGDLEVMVKHPLIEPDAATAGRLFITNFQTNTAADKVNPALEIESAYGTVTPITVEKTDAAAVATISKFPLFPQAHIRFAPR
jgi:hypothetical protein